MSIYTDKERRGGVHNPDGTTGKRSGPQSLAQIEFAKDHSGEAPVTLYLHCQKVYEAMLQKATRVQTQAVEPMDEDSWMIVYEGALTRLITIDLNLSVPYYTSVTQALKGMGCIRQLRRGGSSTLSQWEMITEPTEEAFSNQQPSKRKGGIGKYAMLEQRVADQGKRIDKLEQALRNVMDDA